MRYISSSKDVYKIIIVFKERNPIVQLRTRVTVSAILAISAASKSYKTDDFGSFTANNGQAKLARATFAVSGIFAASDLYERSKLLRLAAAPQSPPRALYEVLQTASQGVWAIPPGPIEPHTFLGLPVTASIRLQVFLNIEVSLHFFSINQLLKLYLLIQA